MASIQTPLDEYSGFAHPGLFYSSDAEYRAAVLDFIDAGVAADEPVLVAVPGAKVNLLRDGLDGAARRVTFTDMTELGRNPARIIPEVRGFIDAHAHRRVRFVGEPIWATRSPVEISEATRHEALINAAFADTQATILCPYDTTALAPNVLADAERTHPVVIEKGRHRVSSRYTEPPFLPPGCDHPLSPPPEDADALAFHTAEDLAEVRAVVAERAARAGLAPDRLTDLVVAVGEVATNTMRHTNDSGVLRTWCCMDEFICQVEDRGHIMDPLIDRRRPAAVSVGGYGLWLVNRLCDLVQIRSHGGHTTVRMHLRTAS